MLTPPIVLIYAHPNPQRSHVNRSLAATLEGLPHVQVHDLYRRYPDYDIDVVEEQRSLAAAGTVVLQFPVHWYSVPALLKLWFDEVLERGWAYGPGGTALRGKSMLAVVTTGGRADSYTEDGPHRHDLETFFLPLAQTARLCGMEWLPPVIRYNAHHLTPDEVLGHIASVASLLGTDAEGAQ